MCILKAYTFVSGPVLLLASVAAVARRVAGATSLGSRGTTHKAQNAVGFEAHRLDSLPGADDVDFDAGCVGLRRCQPGFEHDGSALLQTRLCDAGTQAVFVGVVGVHFLGFARDK